MGRPVYQPITEENKQNAKFGQIIMNIFDGHISTNNNGMIVSATKDIENKFEDFDQIKYNLLEQDRVLNKLEGEYNYFLKYVLDPLYLDTLESLSKVKRSYNIYNYLEINFNNVKGFINDLDVALSQLKASTNSQLSNLNIYKDKILKILKDMETMEEYILNESNEIVNLRDLLNIEISKEYPGV